jgi:hypothetical protein
VTVDQPHRPQRVLAWVDGVWGWLSQALEGITWLVGFCAILSLVGFGYLPFDVHGRNEARSLQTQGEWVIAQDVQVHVHYNMGGRGGGWHEVDRVRVRVDGRATLVDLENVNAAQGNSIYEGISEGWQQPTPITRYEPPLDIRVRRDGHGTILTAMAKLDYEYWTENNTDPEFGLTLGFGGLGIAALALALNGVRLRCRTRRGHPLKSRP